MSKYFIITIFAILLILLVLPQVVWAGLVPCGRDCAEWETKCIKYNESGKCIGSIRECKTPGEGVPKEEAQPCNICHFFIGIQKLLKGIGFVIAGWAAVFVVVGGIMILTAGGSPESASKGKKVITYAIIGIIIAFFAWFIINEVMLLMLVKDPIKRDFQEAVAEDRIPWPWDKIECAVGEPPSATHKECVSNACKEVAGAGEDQCITDVHCEEVIPAKICRCELESGSVQIKTYSNEEGCQDKCEDECETFIYERFCCVQDPDQQCASVSPKDVKKHCICETPVYTIDPNDYPDLTSVLGTEVKGTELENKDECVQKCIPENANSYCHSRSLTNLNEANLYCASQNEMESKQADCVKAEDISHDIEYLKNFFTEQACQDSINVDNATSFDEECAKKCWIDGQFYCQCADRGVTGYLLYRTGKEKTVGTYLNAFSCIINCKHNQGGKCRLGSFQEPTGCESGLPAEEWCQRTAPAGSENWALNPPPGGAKSEQKGDASEKLTSLLNCMYEKLPDLKINSISSNALCDDPGCDTEQSGVCGHAADSCHFGGTNCTGKSYAVDFHTNVSCTDIKTAALQCDSTAWVNWETNHTHVSVNNSVCGCNESGAGTPCP